MGIDKQSEIAANLQIGPTSLGMVRIYVEADGVDLPLDFESMAAAGSLLGTRALQIFDETTSVVRTTLRWTEFYKHESCGKCTPCREGNWWMVQTLRNFEAGTAKEGDVDKLLDVAANIGGQTVCALADGAEAAVTSAGKTFREEFEAGYHTPAWELFPYEKTALFSAESETAGAHA